MLPVRKPEHRSIRRGELTRPLTIAQKEYLEALDLNEKQLVMYECEGNDNGYG